MKLYYKRHADDWVVEECGSQVLSEEGEHAWFWVEKRLQNSEDVARALAQHFGVARKDVGYAGRKDKHGITRQWFSVATPRTDWPALEGVRCISVHRHRRKLRTGQLVSNWFDLVLHSDSALSDDHMHSLRQLNVGFANYFGPQRLSGENFEQAVTWLTQRRQRRISQNKRAWHLSVLRSKLFNAVLDQRMTEVGLPGLIEGDVLVHGFPSAPLWGRGRSPAKAAALDLERAALAPFAEICEALEYAGVTQGRRAAYVRPQEFSVMQLDNQSARLRFRLPAGAYATSLLASLPYELIDASQPQPETAASYG